jgi:trk system potassium uptake protein TrkH
MTLLHHKDPTRKGKVLSPGRVSMLSYAVLILLGAMLLLLPVSTEKGDLGFIDALFISILLMFVGTAPGSCGGGGKVTTISSIAILGYSKFRGKEHPHIFYRRVSDVSISKAVSLLLISMLVIIIGVVLLLQAEIGDVSHKLTRGSFLEILYEVVSAFGTVGLSTGITSGFSGIGKLLIICIMFIGRLGPMGVAMALSRKGKPSNFSYAQENIMIG